MDKATILATIASRSDPYNSKAIFEYLKKYDWDERRAFEDIKNPDHDKIEQIISKSDIKAITFNDHNYPSQLKAINNPPAILFYIGNIDLLNKPSIAIVGTRKITDYGKRTTDIFTSGLSKAGIVITSGLAFGVDAQAHRSCLDNRGETIAVLGNGIDEFMPRSNQRLAKDIIANKGLIISEYPPMTPGMSFTFPLRNRIIAGLSKALIVTEADIKSGSLITARLALDQGKDVFAVPGSIFNQTSRGCNYLIKNGAHPLTDQEDILEYFGIKDITGTKIIASSKNIFTPAETHILNKLKNSPDSLDVDSLLANSDYQAQDITVAVSMLEIGGYITNLGNGRYALK